MQYQPRLPKSYSPPIGLIGCGGITRNHLKAYKTAGLNVVALCDLNLENARQRQEEFYPDARLFDDYNELLKVDAIEVVDITTHPHQRPPIVAAALQAKKHVLSQKPFVLDLDEGEQLVAVAKENGRLLAVNQNGRWAPHFRYIQCAIDEGLLGDLCGVHMSVHWDHDAAVKGSEFEKVHQLILYDYAIHWFDLLSSWLPEPQQVFATLTSAPGQTIPPPLLGQAIVGYENAQASLAFDAFTPVGSQDRTFVAGTKGTISSVGPGNKVQRLTMETATGVEQPQLEGSWFPDGFRGTMGELLCAIEEGRQPTISAESNLRSLALCFAAVFSAERSEIVVPGEVRQLPK